MPDIPEWHGEERRGIPIHILNYMDDRLKMHTDHVEAIFHAHTKEEMDRYSEILDLITENAEKSEQRHSTLIQSLQSYTDGMNMKCQDVSSAFIKGPDGKPDFEGHRNDHDKRKKFGDWWDNVKDKLLTKILEWGALAFVVWVVHSLWEAFLKGPSK